MKFVPECPMTHKMCDKAVNRCFFVFDSIPNQYITQECVTILFLKILFQ